MIAASIDIIANKIVKSDLIGGYVKTFFNDLRNFFKTSAFVQKLDLAVNRVKVKIDKFQKMCESWYTYYEKFDISKMNDIADELDKKITSIKDINCIKENSIIQNMTALINNKLDKLSKTQMEICSNL